MGIHWAFRGEDALLISGFFALCQVVEGPREEGCWHLYVAAFEAEETLEAVMAEGKSLDDERGVIISLVGVHALLCELMVSAVLSSLASLLTPSPSLSIL